MSHWSEKYIHIPYVHGGRTFSGLDCYGLVVLVYRMEFGIAVPDVVIEDGRNKRLDTIHAFEDAHTGMMWVSTSNPVDGDIVEIKIGGHPLHCGIVVPGHRMLHIVSGFTAHIERLDSIRWASRITGYFMHKDRYHE